MATRDYNFDLELCRELSRQVREHEAKRPKYSDYDTLNEYSTKMDTWVNNYNGLNTLAKSNGFIRIFDGSYKLDLRLYPAHN